VTAGCGADPAADHRRNADAICGETRAKIDALGEPATMAQLERVAQRTLPIARDGVRRLGRLEGKTAESRALLTELARQLPLIVQVREAAALRQVERLERLAREGRALETRADRLAREAGMRVCGTDPAVPGG
jgi:hypothetical protein